jgi:hypothetical protein
VLEFIFAARGPFWILLTVAVMVSGLTTAFLTYRQFFTRIRQLVVVDGGVASAVSRSSKD